VPKKKISGKKSSSSFIGIQWVELRAVQTAQPDPSNSQALGLKSIAAELMQKRSPVGSGPSGKTWPRCEPQ